MLARRASVSDGQGIMAGRILVVHEDPAFTCAVRRMLGDAGYFVLECNDPAEAIVSVLRGDEYDLILVDVPLRASVATDLHERVTAMDAEIASRVVFLAEPDVVLPPTSPRIAKPIDGEALRDWVAEFVTLRTQPPQGFDEGGAS